MNAAPSDARTTEAKSGRVLCIGVTPCVQRTLRFSALRVGEVNRARQVSVSAAGKATNAARVLRTLGAHPLLISFAGGAAGEVVKQCVAEEGIDARWIATAGETRTCQTLIDESGRAVTELVEEAPAPREEEWRRFDVELESVLPGARQILISGRLPPGSPPEVYAGMIRRAKLRKVAALVDTQAEALIRALEAGPALVKINHHELVEAMGDARARAESARDAGAEWALITRGPEPAVLAGPTGAWTYVLPALRPVNPIGSGDATLAGTAHALSLGKTMQEAVAFGLACGCANAVTETPGVVDPAEVDGLLPRIRVDPA